MPDTSAHDVLVIDDDRKLCRLISDYLEPAIEPQHCPAILDRLRTHLEADMDWDVCDWQDLSANTPLSGLKSDGKFELGANPDTSCSEIRLTGTFDEFRNARPKDLKRNLRRYRKKAEAIGRLEFEVLKEAHSESMQALVALPTFQSNRAFRSVRFVGSRRL